MIIKEINLGERFPNVKFKAMLHDEDNSTRTAVIVFPGGAYFMIADREGEPIAERFFEAGMNAFVLRYSVAPNAVNYTPLIEAASGIKYVREHASEFNVHSDKIVTCGFSAGGHLAGSTGILWNIPEVRSALGIESGDAPEGINRPNGMILCYPVITGGKYGNVFSMQNLLGKKEFTEAESDKFSLEKHVDSTTPPMFLWHTYNDEGVPIQNSTLIIDAYLNNGLSFESHIYPNGPHGMGLGTKATEGGNPAFVDPHVATWSDLAVMWLRETFK